MAELRVFEFDFGDGAGPITVYGRRMNLRESKIIEEHKKVLVSFDGDGKKIQTLQNSSEWLTHVFLTLAKDATGMRMFMLPADQDRVWTQFEPEAVYAAAVELMGLEADPGN